MNRATETCVTGGMGQRVFAGVPRQEEREREQKDML